VPRRADEESFTALYRRHQAALYRFALRVTGSTWAAEEIVQDVFMTLMREPKKYDSGRGPVGAYLYGIARNPGDETPGAIAARVASGRNE